MNPLIAEQNIELATAPFDPQIGAEPERNGRKWLADSQREKPGVEKGALLGRFAGVQRDRVNQRGVGVGEGRIAAAKPGE